MVALDREQLLKLGTIDIAENSAVEAPEKYSVLHGVLLSKTSSITRMTTRITAQQPEAAILLVSKTYLNITFSTRNGGVARWPSGKASVSYLSTMKTEDRGFDPRPCLFLFFSFSFFFFKLKDSK